jgi:hypothetical protein
MPISREKFISDLRRSIEDSEDLCILFHGSCMVPLIEWVPGATEANIYKIGDRYYKRTCSHDCCSQILKKINVSPIGKGNG